MGDAAVDRVGKHAKGKDMTTDIACEGDPSDEDRDDDEKPTEKKRVVPERRPFRDRGALHHNGVHKTS